MTPAMWAARYGHAKVIHELLQRKDIDFNIQNKLGNTVLMIAIKYGHFEVVEKLLEHKDRIRLDLYIKNKAGQIAVMIAVKEGKKEISELLIEKGADINVGLDIKRENKKIWLIAGGIGLGLMIVLGGLVAGGIVVAIMGGVSIRPRRFGCCRSRSWYVSCRCCCNSGSCGWMYVIWSFYCFTY